MKVVKIDCDEVHDWESFHDLFSEKFGFPSFYGKNMDAWIDCMSSLDSPEDGMTTIHVEVGNTITIELDNIDALIKRNKEIYEAILECSAFVNFRKLEMGEQVVLTLSFDKK